MATRAEVQGLIEELEALDRTYWEEDSADPEASTEAASNFIEKSDKILEYLNDYLQRCY